MGRLFSLVLRTFAVAQVGGNLNAIELIPRELRAGRVRARIKPTYDRLAVPVIPSAAMDRAASHRNSVRRVLKVRPEIGDRYLTRFIGGLFLRDSGGLAIVTFFGRLTCAPNGVSARTRSTGPHSGFAHQLVDNPDTYADTGTDALTVPVVAVERSIRSSGVLRLQRGRKSDLRNQDQDRKHE